MPSDDAHERVCAVPSDGDIEIGRADPVRLGVTGIMCVRMYLHDDVAVSTGPHHLPL